MKGTKKRYRLSHNGRRIAIRLPAQRLRQQRRDPRACAWHAGDWTVDWSSGGVGCMDCGRLYYTKQCPGCGRDFLDFDAHYADDIMTGPAVSDRGDLTCIDCVTRYERDEDDWDDEMDDRRDWAEEWYERTLSSEAGR